MRMLFLNIPMQLEDSKVQISSLEFAAAKQNMLNAEKVAIRCAVGNVAILLVDRRSQLLICSNIVAAAFAPLVVHRF